MLSQNNVQNNDSRITLAIPAGKIDCLNVTTKYSSRTLTAYTNLLVMKMNELKLELFRAVL